RRRLAGGQGLDLRAADVDHQDLHAHAPTRPGARADRPGAPGNDPATSLVGGIGAQLALDPELHLAQLVADVVVVRPGPVDGVVVEAGDDVPVDVIDRLA